MPFEMLVEQEYLSYNGFFSKPPFGLWGQGGTILEGLYDALSPFGVTVNDFRLEAGSQSPAEQGVTVTFANRGTHSFRFDRVESRFFNLGEDFILKIPAVLAASTDWLRRVVPSLGFASHQFLYSCHNRLKATSTDEFLGRLNTRSIRSAGTERGRGSIFHWVVPEKNWETHLVLDRSTVLKDAFYMAFTLTVTADVVDYENLAQEGPSYLGRVLGDFGLRYPYSAV